MQLSPTVIQGENEGLPENWPSFLNSSIHGLLLTDQQGLPLYWNRGFLSLLGLKSLENFADRVKKEGISCILSLTKDLKLKNPDNFEIRLRQVYSAYQDARLRISLAGNKALEIHVQWQLLSNGKKNCLWSIQDISEEATKVKYLEGLNERYETALRSGEDGVWDWNLKENILYLSPRWENILIPDSDGLRKRPLHSLWDLCLRMSPEEREVIEEKLNEHMRGSSPFFEVEFPIGSNSSDSSSSRFLWVRMRGVSLRDEKREVYRMSGMIMDITERKISETRRELVGLHDRLTGLPNHSSFRKKLSEILNLKGKSQRKLEKKQGYAFSVLFIRLGSLGTINEGFGPDYGDKLVKELSRRLQKLTRQEDFLARYEGNKFALILQNTSTKEEVETFSKRIRKSLSRPIEIEEQTFVIEVSMGVILPPPSYAKVRDVIHECTKALGKAKKKGKNICILEGIGLKDQEAMDFFYFNDLARKSFQNQEFVLHFQPIIDLHTNKIKSCEGLLRLKNQKLKEESFLDLPKFIHALEQSGQIVKLGPFVLREACAFAQKLEESGFEDCEVKINISPRELEHESFYDEAEEILKTFPLEKCRLCLEITENVFLNYNQAIGERLRRLKNLGFRFALDDFGTGYSSFSFLRDLPIDIVKIDRSFLAKALDSEKDGALLATMIVMAHTLSLEVVAEGVESKEELAFLKRFECDHAQGFLYSPAMATPDFIDYVKAYRPSLPSLHHAAS